MYAQAIAVLNKYFPEMLKQESNVIKSTGLICNILIISTMFMTLYISNKL
jgi:hypothetical protein